MTSSAPAWAARAPELLRRHDVPGAAIARCVAGSIDAIGVGHRNLDRQDPMPADARFPIYSITKTFIATALLRLAAAGDLALEAPVLDLLPGLPEAIDRDITIRRLLNHTAGLPDYGGVRTYHDDLRRDPASPWSDDEFLERTLRQGMLFPPGEGWAYSNIGYLLLRRVIEETSGTSLGDALGHLVFAPAGLRETTVLASPSDMASLTPGYSTALREDDTPEDIAPRYHPGWVSHGLVASTAADIARFLDALANGTLLNDANLATMRTPVLVPGDHPPFVEPSYGLGVMLDPGSPHGLILGHGGGGPGYATAAFHAPDVDGTPATAVALVNRDGSNAPMDLAFALLTRDIDTHA